MRLWAYSFMLVFSPNACDCGKAMTTERDAGHGQTDQDAALACDVSIEHTALNKARFGDIVIQASSLGALTLFYRRSLDDEPYTSLHMTGQGEQTATIPQEALSFAGMDYYLISNTTDCQQSSPEDLAKPYHIDIFGEAPVSSLRDKYDYSPCVYEHQVVFSREEDDGDNVFLFDLDRMASRQITHLAHDQGNAEIFAHNIIWDDYRHGNQSAPNSDIYLFDLDRQEEFQVTTDPKSQYGSVLDGRLITWRDDRNMNGPINGDIYIYDMGPDQIMANDDDEGEFQISSSEADQSSPHVHVRADGRGLVVWDDMRDDTDGVCDSNCDKNIYLYDSGADGVFGTADDSGVIQVTDDPHAQDGAALGERWIVWRDARAGDWLHPELYAYDMGPDGIFGNADDGGEQKIAITSSEPDNLDIDGDRLVYDDYRNGSYEIYLYEFSKEQEIQITDAYRGQFYPRIFGDVIVWQDARNNDPGAEPFDDIYMYVLPPN